MPEPLVVLQVIPRMRAGGAELGCLQIAQAIMASGGRALVASQGGRLADELVALGATHITLPLATKNPLGLMSNARALAQLIRAHKVDIIHARSRAPAWSALWAAKKTNIPFVTTYHSEYSEKTRLKNLYNSVMVRGDMVIAVSDYMAHLIRTRYGTPEERITVIHRAFDPERFNAAAVTPEKIAEMRARLNLGESDRVLILAGRITPRKAQDHLVEALGLLKARGMDHIVAVLAGEIEKPDFEAALRARAQRLGVDSWLRFPGHVTDMPVAYCASDISLNISEQEGLPRVAIESQAMGVPLIVSDTGPGREVALTPPDVPLAQASGLRVPYANPKALADAIAQMLEWPAQERKAAGERGAHNVRARFTLDQLKSKTLQVYDTVLRRRKSPKVTAGV